MPVASAVHPLAYTDPILFSFQWRQKIKVQVRFYSDAAGTVTLAKGLGSRDVTVSTFDTVTEPGTTYTDTLESDYAFGTKTVAGGTWTEFEFADGSSNASFVCAGGANPGGAVSYRVILSVRPGVV